MRIILIMVIIITKGGKEENCVHNYIYIYLNINRTVLREYEQFNLFAS